jgi:hypothetical protein
VLLDALASIEQWSLGRASRDDVLSDGHLAAEFAEDARSRSLFGAYAGYAVAYAAAVCAYAGMPEVGERASNCAIFAARAVASRPLEDGPYLAALVTGDEREELVRLRSVVASACCSCPLVP